MTDPQRPDDAVPGAPGAGPTDALTPEELAAAENAALTEAIDETEPDAAAPEAEAGTRTSLAEPSRRREPEPETRGRSRTKAACASRA